jgi:hypothetical protein
MVVEFTMVKCVAVAVPNLTALAENRVPLKFVPVMVTVVPPEMGPADGFTPETVGGGATNLNLLDDEAVPPGVVTEMANVPGTWALVVAVMVVGLVTVNVVTLVVPNFTSVAVKPGMCVSVVNVPLKFVPVMVTVVPPLVGPVVGVNEVMVGGGGTNLKSVGAVAGPVTLVTVTGTVPRRWGKVTAVMVVGPTTVKLCAVVVPNFTELTAKPGTVNPVPEMVTVVVPVVRPVAGEIDVMVGIGTTKVNSVADVAVSPAVVTFIGTAPTAWAGVTALMVVGLVTV